MRKQCIGCGETKDISEFSPKGKGRWQPRCKLCRSAEARAKRAGAKPEKPPDNVVELRPSKPKAPKPPRAPAEPSPPDLSDLGDSDLRAELLNRQREFLDAPNDLQKAIEEEMKDVLPRAAGLLATMRFVGPRWIAGDATSAEIAAYKDSQKQVVELFETRRKEMANRDVGHEIAEEWRDFRSSPVVIGGD